MVIFDSINRDVTIFVYDKMKADVANQKFNIL